MSEYQELLEIHTILAAPGDCPPIKDNDTLTIKRLKILCYQMNSLRLVARGEWDIGRRCFKIIGLTEDADALVLNTKNRIELFAMTRTIHNEG